MVARWLSLILGFWLMVSVFFWPHTGQEWMTVGVMWSWVFVVTSAASFVEPRVRYGAGVLGIILAVYSLFASRGFTRWHDFVVGILFVIFAAIPSEPLVRHRIRPRRHVRT